MAAIRRLDLGHIVRPAHEAGNSGPRAEAILGYLVRCDQGLLLFDTGIGAGSPEADEHYRPVRRPLPQALADAGVDVSDVDLVVNCHLHFDHCGGNPLFAGVPILAQAVELAAARGPDYTIGELVDFTGASYRELHGEEQIWPGVWVTPTPGHTAGHQSLVVQQPDGTVVLAGQAHDFASDFEHDQMAMRAGLDGYPQWLERILSFDPRRVLFAHDNAVWDPYGAEAVNSPTSRDQTHGRRSIV